MTKKQAGLVKPKLVAVVGPTASGKTALAIKIAQRFNGEVISADSRQIYRGMDIGTAKICITNQTRKRVPNIREYSRHPVFEIDSRIPHYLVNIRDVNEDYVVAEYKRDAIRAIRSILRRGKLPILAGGTGLYVRAVVENLDIPSVKANTKLRERLEREIKMKGLGHLFKRLVALDPDAADAVDPKNPRRVIRALEVALATGKPFTAQRKKGEPLFAVLQLGITLPREELQARISRRIDGMFKDGLVNEVRRLIKRYSKDQKAFDAIGYREVIAYLDGKISKEECVAQMERNTWHYAKRQLTWFRKDKTVHWIKNSAEALRLVSKFVNR